MMVQLENQREAVSGVSLDEEMANMISASRAYQNNVEVVNATRRMLSATINLGR